MKTLSAPDKLRAIIHSPSVPYEVIAKGINENPIALLAVSMGMIKHLLDAHDEEDQLRLLLLKKLDEYEDAQNKIILEAMGLDKKFQE